MCGYITDCMLAYPSIDTPHSYWVALASTLVGLFVLLPVHVHGGNGMHRLEQLSLANVAVSQSVGCWGREWVVLV